MKIVSTEVSPLRCPSCMRMTPVKDMTPIRYVDYKPDVRVCLPCHEEKKDLPTDS